MALESALRRGEPLEYKAGQSLGFAQDWNLNNEIVPVDVDGICEQLGRPPRVVDHPHATTNRSKRPKVKVLVDDGLASVSSTPLLSAGGGGGGNNRKVALCSFFRRDFDSSEDGTSPQYWRFAADKLAKQRLPVGRNGFHAREMGDLLSFWLGEQQSSSHQYLCCTGLFGSSSSAPVAVAGPTLALTTEDRAPLLPLFPEGTTGFIRLMPGESTQKLRITIILASDTQLLVRGATGNQVDGAPRLWKSNPASPFVRSREFVLESDGQIVCVPPGCWVAIRNADSRAEAKIFYYLRLAVFPTTSDGVIKFVLHPGDLALRHVVLWNAAHGMMEWASKALVGGGAADDDDDDDDYYSDDDEGEGGELARTRRRQLVHSFLCVQQCVAFVRDMHRRSHSHSTAPTAFAAAVTASGEKWDWAQLVKDMASILPPRNNY